RTPETHRRSHAGAIVAETASRDAYLKLADDLEGFLAQLRGNAATATVEDRQRVLRLLVKDILLGPEKITIRHRIPARPGGSGARQRDPGPDTEGDHRPGYLSRWGRERTALWRALPAIGQLPVLQDSRVQPFHDQPQDPLVRDPVPEEPFQPSPRSGERP